MSEVKLDTQFFPKELLAQAESQLPKAKSALSALKDKTCVGSEWTGWFNYPETTGLQLVEEVSNYVCNLDVEYDLVLVIGIGGSYLGTRAVADALTHEFSGSLAQTSRGGARPLVVYAGHHLSEKGLAELLDLLEHKDPVINIISKSGTTTEPGVAFRIVRDHLQKRYSQDELSKRIIATTDPKKGALRELATKEGYATFEVPTDIGGRYSVLSPVGLVPLALGKFDIKALMEGADLIFKELSSDVSDHSILHYAACRYAAYNSGKHLELLSYSEPKLAKFIEWWRQLFGESEGKERKGLFPVGMCFTTDLHSLGQYVQQGTKNLMETFLVFNEARKQLQVPSMDEKLDGLTYLEGRNIEEINQAAMLATKIAHFDGEVPCLELQVGSLSERTIGSLFAFFKTACAVSGALLGVNPYDQPGVESYKTNLFGLLGKPGFEEIGGKLRSRIG